MSEQAGPTVGEGIKNAQLGGGKYLTLEQIQSAPTDLVEEDLPIPEWGGTIRLRSLTAAQATAVKQRGLAFKGEETKVAWEAMEVLQVAYGLVEPKLTEDEIKKLRLSKSAAGFDRITTWIDQKSGIDKEELRKAQQEFQDADD